MGTVLNVYEGAFAPTLSDTGTDANGPFAGLIVTVVGTLKVHTVAGQDVSFAATTVGQLIPLAVTRVWSTGTSATVVGLSMNPYKPALNPGAGTVL